MAGKRRKAHGGKRSGVELRVKPKFVELFQNLQERQKQALVERLAGGKFHESKLHATADGGLWRIHLPWHLGIAAKHDQGRRVLMYIGDKDGMENYEAVYQGSAQERSVDDAVPLCDSSLARYLSTTNGQHAAKNRLVSSGPQEAKPDGDFASVLGGLGEAVRLLCRQAEELGGSVLVWVTR